MASAGRPTSSRISLGPNLLPITSTARSVGTFVNSEIISKESRVYPWGILRVLVWLTKSELLATKDSVFPTRGNNTLAKNFESAYVEEKTNETIGLQTGVPLRCDDDEVMSSPIHCMFWKRYVDDVLCAIPGDGIEDMLAHINSINSNIQFTYEKLKKSIRPFPSWISRSLVSRMDPFPQTYTGCQHTEISTDTSCPITLNHLNLQWSPPSQEEYQHIAWRKNRNLKRNRRFTRHWSKMDIHGGL